MNRNPKSVPNRRGYLILEDLAPAPFKFIVEHTADFLTRDICMERDSQRGKGAMYLQSSGKQV